MKKGYHIQIESATQENNDFRRVLYTGSHMQLVLMSLSEGESIGQEVHENHDQFFRFESGTGNVTINDNQYEVKDGDVVIVPAGASHNVTNTGLHALKLYTLYAPAHHKDGIVRHTKEEAIANEASFDGQVTEK